jgi:hypothetical protein
VRNDLTQVADAISGGDATIRQRLEDARRMLELCDLQVPLNEVAMQLEGYRAHTDSMAALGEALLVRLELDVLQQRLPDGLLELAERWLEQLEADQGDKRLAPRLASVEVVDRLHHPEFDYEAALAACEQARANRALLTEPLGTLVDACWAECMLANVGGTSRLSPAIREELQGLVGVPSHPEALADQYLRYVRSQILRALEADKAVDAAEMMLPIFQAAPLPVFIESPQRKNAADETMRKAVQALRSGGDDQITKPAFDTVSAERALRYLQPVSQQLRVSSDELVRQTLVACFHRSVPNHRAVLGAIQRVDLSPQNKPDGMLLFIKSQCEAMQSNVSSDALLHSYANVL